MAESSMENRVRDIEQDHPSAVVLSTACFPPVEYFSYIAVYDAVYIEACEHFNKQTYRNRYAIISANGPLDQVVPVKRAHGKKTAIGDVGIDYDLLWQVRQWRALFSAYNRSPFFLYYADDIEPFFRKRYGRLYDYNMDILKTLLRLLGISKEVSSTRSFKKHYTQALDMRYTIHPKRPLTMDLAPWVQVFSDKQEFYPRVSILDLLFNMGPESRRYLEQAGRDAINRGIQSGYDRY